MNLGHDTYPAFLRSTWPLDAGRSGGSKKIRGVNPSPSAATQPARSMEKPLNVSDDDGQKAQCCSCFSG
jgi:hypothetical protein